FFFFFFSNVSFQGAAIVRSRKSLARDALDTFATHVQALFTTSQTRTTEHKNGSAHGRALAFFRRRFLT
ncbi:hypothetical protein, partial [Thiolapillus sp.]|uniref:hypothetical protein n=1 Tax=Thiolapillus sp. TaxID=2017437 RepID=UPI003AF63F79